MEKRFLISITKGFYFNNGQNDVSSLAIHGNKLEVNPTQGTATTKKRAAIYSGRPK